MAAALIAVGYVLSFVATGAGILGIVFAPDKKRPWFLAMLFIGIVGFAVASRSAI